MRPEASSLSVTPYGGFVSLFSRHWQKQSRIVRLPLNQVGSLNKISKAFSKFEQENERRPSPEELADELEIPVDKISDTLKVSGRHISVDAPFVEGEDNSLLDVLVNDARLWQTVPWLMSHLRGKLIEHSLR